MNVKSNVITIDEDRTPSTISIDRATPVPTKAHMTTSITPNVNSHARSMVAHITVTDCRESSEYVVEQVVDHRHTSENLI